MFYFKGEWCTHLLPFKQDEFFFSFLPSNNCYLPAPHSPLSLNHISRLPFFPHPPIPLILFRLFLTLTLPILILSIFSSYPIYTPVLIRLSLGLHWEQSDWNVLCMTLCLCEPLTPDVASAISLTSDLFVGRILGEFTETCFLTGKYSRLNLMADIKSLHPPPPPKGMPTYTLKHIERGRSFSFAAVRKNYLFGGQSLRSNGIYMWWWRKYVCAVSRLKWCNISQCGMCWCWATCFRYLFINKLHEFNVVGFQFSMCYGALLKLSLRGCFPPLTGGSSFKCKEIPQQQYVFVAAWF